MDQAFLGQQGDRLSISSLKIKLTISAHRGSGVPWILDPQSCRGPRDQELDVIRMTG